MTLYIDNDRHACRWLRALVEAGHLKGEVHEHDIKQLRPRSLRGVRRVHLFAGIGGWELALQLAGWPASREVWTGSCPCQPFSTAGKMRANRDPRNLWPDFRRLIAHCRPATIFGEQVASHLGRRWLAGVRADLEALGYSFGAADLCAAGVASPHIRQRLYWVADSGRVGPQSRRPSDSTNDRLLAPADSRDGREPCTCSQGKADRKQARPSAPTYRLGNADLRRKHESEKLPTGSGFVGSAWAICRIVVCDDPRKGIVVRRASTESGAFPLAHGVPARMGRLRGYGNAIVPQLAAEFIRAFLETERLR